MGKFLSNVKKNGKCDEVQNDRNPLFPYFWFAITVVKALTIKEEEEK
jgi:hypothetical protein